MGVNGTATPVFPSSSSYTAQKLQLSRQDSTLQLQRLAPIGRGIGSFLQLVRSTLVGLFNVTNLIPTGFGFLRA
ncbi:hypothetical protein V6N13_022816 [Hibiscus sabdariffa]